MKRGWAFRSIISFARDGGFVTGICGGYQMLVKTLIDEEGTDTGKVDFEETGLGLMEAVTYFRKEKADDTGERDLSSANRYWKRENRRIRNSFRRYDIY